jgi:acetyl-CoA C-acetyltransferase
VIPAGCGQAPDRQVSLEVGCNVDTPTTLVNKVCASGMKAVMLAANQIRLGDRDVCLAGGMENMSKIPHYMYLRTPTGYGHATAIDAIQFDGLTDVYNNILMGSCVEKTNSDMGISREAQDEFAIMSYNRAREAQQNNLFGDEICGITLIDKKKKEVAITEDEECKKFFPDKFPSLRPAFSKTGSITAANASKINDGAAALVLMDEQTAKDRGLKPLARIVGFEDAAVHPIDFGIAPAKACDRLLKRVRMNVNDIDFHEINEAFAAVALANIKLLDLDVSKVNVHGGAVALGHPIGCSGARIIVSLLNVLKKNNGSVGMASICNGGGGASAIVVERLN